MGQRMFVALVPPEDVLGHLEEFLAVRREAATFRWSLPEHLHVTLAFMASVPERRLDDLVERLGLAAARRTPFATRVAGGGAFPDVARARVLYAGLSLTEGVRKEFERLAAGTRIAASTAGTQTDGQRFHPHVTVARLGRPTEVTRWVQLLDGYEGLPWQVDEVSLVASHLGEGPRKRPRYEVVGTFPLGGDGS
ncbi:RNA 2',3'-cyclic phosphodiesterase [Nocardioides psychrotolerans]|uniref:RNA 2',3'-cyclic phosphodiesterase n=1 Tax=Nocardioides psychrotolerans TaxID=1005945 RepID=A0A1I3E2P3_9ACTN|nr:RNA 2',3'-cyclic phosphodiesterase [Nocardioides psychrotolerans]GEP37536.1 RNA 2',3'-cyclic phosphodiesterase [Nocardioides psychrotolerans]SFH93244.1 2'-5' RNA ligase [Nocardioides psychrotolerans]